MTIILGYFIQKAYDRLIVDRLAPGPLPGQIRKAHARRDRIERQPIDTLGRRQHRVLGLPETGAQRMHSLPER